MSKIHGVGDVWRLTRRRLSQGIEDLNDEQWHWRPHSQAHTIAEICVHLAGAEHYWWARMCEIAPTSNEFDPKLDRAVIDGFLEDHPFPYTSHELTHEFVLERLTLMCSRIDVLYQGATEAQLSMPVRSPIGDDIDGYEGLLRLSQHAGYHTGQIWQMRLRPDFPSGD